MSGSIAEILERTPPSRNWITNFYFLFQDTAGRYTFLNIHCDTYMVYMYMSPVTMIIYIINILYNTVWWEILFHEWAIADGLKITARTWYFIETKVVGYFKYLATQFLLNTAADGQVQLNRFIFFFSKLSLFSMTFFVFPYIIKYHIKKNACE